MDILREAIKRFKGAKVTSIDVEPYEKFSHFAPSEVSLDFDNKGNFSFAFWRLVEPKGTFSFFDHNQKYGGEKVIDAYDYLKKTLQGKRIEAADIDPETGDVTFLFDDIKLQVFKLNGYENWVLRFPDGAEEYSNYVEGKLSSKQKDK